MATATTKTRQDFSSFPLAVYVLVVCLRPAQTSCSEGSGQMMGVDQGREVDTAMCEILIVVTLFGIDRFLIYECAETGFLFLRKGTGFIAGDVYFHG